MSSIFDGLYIARSGVRSSRAALNVTGQNITNANTPGYTRQRVDQSAIPSSEYGGQWASTGAAVGNGSSVDSISQLRDKFLDAEYRTQNAKSGGSSVQVSSLYDLEDIFTSTTTATSSSKSSVIDVLSNEFSNFVSQLELLTASSSKVSESNVRDEAKLLTQKLSTAAKALETIRQQQYTNLKGQIGTPDNPGKLNTMLKDIASLDKQIKNAEVAGSSALELKDQRNLKLDELSQYAGIKVVETPTDVGSGKKVDTMSVCLADQDGNPLTYTDGDGKTQTYTLIGGDDGGSYAQFALDPPASLSSSDQVSLSLTTLSTDGKSTNYQSSDGTKQSVNSKLTTGSFSGYLNLLNAKGEYDTPPSGTRGIGFYSKYLDSVAQKFASTLNDLNYDASKKDAGGNLIPKEKQALIAGTGADGKDSINTADITAANIHVASVWEDGVLNRTKDSVNGATDNGASNSNILAMVGSLKDSTITLSGPDTPGKNPGDPVTPGKIIFTGTLQKAFASESAMLAQDTDSMQSTDNTNSYQLNSINSDRQEISSVSLDDEAVSIVQYSQSLSAASRFMTAVDECLQNIINNMGLAGRG